MPTQEPHHALHTINAEDLFYAQLPKSTFFVEGLLPQGLNMIGGASKIGKSWFVLWLCLQVANGAPIWDKPTTKADALYLALEDPHHRLQERLHRLTDTPPSNLDFAILSDKIGVGLETQLTEYLTEHPQTRLIVIDTLQKVRKVAAGNTFQYASDYDDLGRIKAFADAYRLCILLVHHTRKTPDATDPFNELTGSTGIMGVLDTCFVLKQDSRTANTATLYATGRDIELQEFTLQFEDTRWHLLDHKGASALHALQTPAFVLHLISFLQGKTDWHGTMQTLLCEMGDAETKPNQASKMIAQHACEVLTPQGICYTTNRHAKGRLFHFRVAPPDATAENCADDVDSADELCPEKHLHHLHPSTQQGEAAL